MNKTAQAKVLVYGILIPIAVFLVAFLIFGTFSKNAYENTQKSSVKDKLCTMPILSETDWCGKHEEEKVEEAYMNLEKTRTLTEKLKQCYDDKKTDCLEVLNAIYEVVVQKGQTIKIVNAEESKTSELVVIKNGEEVEKSSQNFRISVCHTTGARPPFEGTILLRKGAERFAEVSYGSSDEQPDPYYFFPVHRIGYVEIGLLAPNNICIYYREKT